MSKRFVVLCNVLVKGRNYVALVHAHAVDEGYEIHVYPV